MTNFTLLKKSILFLSIVLLCQLAVFLALGFALWKTEIQFAKVCYSNQAVTTCSRIGQLFHEASYCLLVWSFHTNDSVAKHFEYVVGLLPETINSLRDERFNTEQDRSDIEKLLNHQQYIISSLTDIRDSIMQNPSPQAFLRMKTLITHDIEPQAADMENALQRFMDRHRVANKTLAAESQMHFMARTVIVAAFVLNLLGTAITVIAFSRGIISRLHIVQDNFGRHAAHKPLHEPLPGSDEIAALDRRFHEVSRDLTLAAEKDAALTNRIPVGLLSYRNDNIIETFNPTACRLFGGELPEQTNLTNLLVQPSDLQLIQKAVDANTSEPIRLRLKRFDSTTFPAEVSISYIQYGDEPRTLLAILDVSAREEIEVMRKEFAALISHDIRTPLTSLKACLSMFGRGVFGEVTEKGRITALAAQGETDRLVRLTTELLDIAKIESGGIDLHSTRCQAESLMLKAAESLSALADEKNIEIKIEPTNAQLLADSDRVVQILINFLSNAVKFSEPGSEVYLFCESVQDGFFKLNVQDWGRGIPEDQLDLVFDRYKQVRRTDAQRGSGLGLAICRLLAQSHGGEVGVVSTLGEGSTFWVTLPAAS